MLPSKDLHTKCLQCGAPQPREQTLCGACGANRDVELAIAAELVPAIATLRRWLLLVAGLLLLSAFVVYQHYQETALTIEFYSAVGVGVLFVVLAAVAPRIPFLASAVAAGLFLLYWGTLAIEDPWAAFAPSLSLGLRIISMVVLLDAVRAGHKAKTIRRRAKEEFPSARIHAEK